MGLLSRGTPLKQNDSKKYIEYVKKHGVIQFIITYNKLKDRSNDKFLQGDEVEYILFSLPQNSKISQLSLRGTEIIDRLNKIGSSHDRLEKQCIFNPEYGDFMIESTPYKPYGGYTSDLQLVESNMRLRRMLIESILYENEYILTVSNHPRLGVGNFTTQPQFMKNNEEKNIKGPIAQSKFIPDHIINPHPRFGCLTANIRERRGSNVDIRIPLFIDDNTCDKGPNIIRNLTEEKTLDIYMDAMAFGMGCNCLQVTFQARNINEARHLYDQLVVLSPIMLALTAATPFHHGLISDNDVRQNVIAQCVDDRTQSEKGLEPLKAGEKRIFKSRYGSVDTYISNNEKFKEEYNDIELVYDEDAFNQLCNSGIDVQLSRHVAHLFIRDPLVIFDEFIHLDDQKSTNHFENIQSTNQQTCRFKPPPEDSNIGQRVEFRSMEIQVTDQENAAFSVFIALLTRAILYFDLNLYIPISKVDENMKTAHQKNSCVKNKFQFRSCIKDDISRNSTSCQKQTFKKIIDLYTINEIMNGNSCEPGLIAIVLAYMDAINFDLVTRSIVEGYLNLISKRASGELFTSASWQREFVLNHPDYKKDSVISELICRDLLETQIKITRGEIVVPKLLGDYIDKH